MKKAIKILGGLAVLVGLSFFVVRYVYDKPMPQGQTGSAADELTEKMFAAINKPAWDSTAWVTWTFRGTNRYIWEKSTDMVQVSWDDTVVMLNTKDQTGQAVKGGKELLDADKKEALEKAWSMFCNDSFWFNAPAKAMDAGTERAVVDLPDGKKGLKVTYSSGGVTPGDSYLWELDENGLPTGYQMWVSIIPVGGVTASWEKWQTLSTGAKVSSFHKIGGKMDLEITGIDGGMGKAPFTF